MELSLLMLISVKFIKKHEYGTCCAFVHLKGSIKSILFSSVLFYSILFYSSAAMDRVSFKPFRLKACYGFIANLFRSMLNANCILILKIC